MFLQHLVTEIFFHMLFLKSSHHIACTFTTYLLLQAHQFVKIDNKDQKYFAWIQQYIMIVSLSGKVKTFFSTCCPAAGCIFRGYCNPKDVYYLPTMMQYPKKPTLKSNISTDCAPAFCKLAQQTYVQQTRREESRENIGFKRCFYPKKTFYQVTKIQPAAGCNQITE